MPPIVAVVLCTVFVIYLLRTDAKQSYGVTRALWIPILWILLIGGKPLGRWFNYSAGSEESSPLDRAFIVILIIVALWILARRKFDWNKAAKENAWLIVLVLYMLASVLWSRMPLTSLFRWIREIPAVLMAFVIITEPSPRHALLSLLRRSFYILVPFSLVLIKYFPAYGVEYGRWSGSQMWIGVTTQKNSLGRLCIMSAMFMLWDLLSNRQGDPHRTSKYHSYFMVIVLFLSLYLLLGPGHDLFYSATSFYSLLLGIIVFIGLLITKKFLRTPSQGIIAAAVTCVMLFGIITLFSGGATIGSAASSAGRDATLTGRTAVWAALLPVAMRQPLLGGGFGGFWTQEMRVIYEISGSHSGYLDILLDLGFVGLLIYFFFVVTTAKKAGYLLHFDYEFGSLSIIFITMAVLHNSTESSLNSIAAHMTAIIIFFSVILNHFVSKEHDQLTPS